MPAPFPLQFPFPFTPGGTPETERDTHPNASHFHFPYFFSDIDGIHFGDIPIPPIPRPKDLLIYYGSLEGDDHTNSWCSRWDTSNYSITVETWLQKEAMDNIIAHTRPGAVTELFNILGRPFYYDTSWDGSNTLRIMPHTGSITSTLPYMRKETIIYPKNITTSPINGLRDWFVFKVEGYISGNSL